MLDDVLVSETSLESNFTNCRLPAAAAAAHKMSQTKMLNCRKHFTVRACVPLQWRQTQ